MTIYTDVKVKGICQEDNFKITIPSRGPVSTIKFSGGTPRVLSVQRWKVSVEFVNIFSENSIERTLPTKQGPDVIGFYWIFKNEYVVLIHSSGVEVYSCNPYKMAFKQVKNYGILGYFLPRRLHASGLREGLQHTPAPLFSRKGHLVLSCAYPSSKWSFLLLLPVPLQAYEMPRMRR